MKSVATFPKGADNSRLGKPSPHVSRFGGTAQQWPHEIRTWEVYYVQIFPIKGSILNTGIDAYFRSSRGNFSTSCSERAAAVPKLGAWRSPPQKFGPFRRRDWYSATREAWDLDRAMISHKHLKVVLFEKWTLRWSKITIAGVLPIQRKCCWWRRVKLLFPIITPESRICSNNRARTQVLISR